MIRVGYNLAVRTMQRALQGLLDEGPAREMAEIFAGNSMDGIHSHGMNRFPRFVHDLQSGITDRTVLEARCVGALGAFEVWDGDFGVGPLIARQMARRAVELAGEHGIGCCALRNNSHWLRAGRYALEMADRGCIGLCATNTCMNLAAYGALEPSTGNNPFAIAVPGPEGSLLLDMAVSQIAYGKLEILAQQGQKLDGCYGVDRNGEPTDDPLEILEGGLLLPMAQWKGNALSMMIDLVVASASDGRTSRQIGASAARERGVSQIYVAIDNRRAVDGDHIDASIRQTMDFLQQLKPSPGSPGMHLPGQHLQKVRETHEKEGIPVTQETWDRIVRLSEGGTLDD